MPRKTEKTEKQELIVFHNQDKLNQQDQPDASNIANFIHPFRMILASPPSHGKTSVIKNIIVNQEPHFNRIIVFHLDPNTSEYSDLDAEIYSEIPKINELIEGIDSSIRNCIICEDIPLKSLKKAESIAMDRAIGYVSSHKNTSIMFSCQDFYNTPSSMRRCCNIFCLWRMPDTKTMKCIGNQMQLPYSVIDYIFSYICKKKYDFLCIDRSDSGPLLRKNLFEPIIHGE